jgi:DNA-binding response OmpR family regulator
MSADAPTSILIVEHDPAIGEALLEQLAADSYRARLARTAEHARVLARGAPPGLVILGDQDALCGALDLLTEIRSDRYPRERPTGGPWPADLPAIVIGSHAQEADLLRAFEAGADDFLARPAPYLELRARLRAVLARTDARRGSPLLRVGPLEIDTDAHTVHLDGRRVQLRRLEYELLIQLARDPGRVLSKQELMLTVWCQRTPRCTRTLDSHACRLRQRLGTDGPERWVVNVRGVGYRLI